MSLAFVAILNRRIAHASGGYEQTFLTYCSAGGLQKIYSVTRRKDRNLGASCMVLRSKNI